MVVVRGYGDDMSGGRRAGKIRVHSCAGLRLLLYGGVGGVGFVHVAC